MSNNSCNTIYDSYQSWFSQTLFKVYAIIKGKVIYKRMDYGTDVIYSLPVERFTHEMRMYKNSGIKFDSTRS